MIRVFSPDDKIFTSNGDAVIQPFKAKVHKEDNGKFYLTVEAKAGKSHVEVIKEYLNGGKDVVTVWDEEPTEAKAAYDETEQIQRYILYTADELKAIADAKAEAERLASLPTVEERLKATEAAIMAMALGGTSNV